MFFKRRKLSEVEFAEKFIIALKEHLPNIEIVFRDGLEIHTILNSHDIKHFLDNAYIQYTNYPKTLKAIIQQYINSSRALYRPKDDTVNWSNIVPVIKDYRYLDEVVRLVTNEEKRLVYKKYNEELYVFYAEDQEHSVSYFNNEQFTETGMSIDEFHQLALENLDRLLEIKKHGEGSPYMLVAGGTYECSIILLNIWDKEILPVKGNFVIGMPSRDMLLVTGSEDSEGLHKLYDMVDNISRDSNYLISDKLFEFKDGKFEVFKL